MEPNGYSPAPPQKSNTALWIILAVCAGGICICGPILAAVLFPVFAQAKLAAQRTATISNAKQHALGLIMYASDWDDKLPHDNWCDSTSQYIKYENAFASKIVQKGDEKRYDFALTATLLGKSMRDVEDVRISIMTFESKNNEKNQVGGPELLPMPGRYSISGANSNGSCASFVDGHVKFIRDDQFPDGLDDRGMFRVRP